VGGYADGGVACAAGAVAGGALCSFGRAVAAITTNNKIPGAMRMGFIICLRASCGPNSTVYPDRDHFT
jgi:hypothetical protein